MQGDSNEQRHIAAQTNTVTALAKHLREMEAEMERKLEEMKLNIRKDMEASTAKAQKATKELERKIEEQDRNQKAQEEHRRLERQNTELRENLRNEREARMWDVIRAQELAAQDSRKLMEAVAREYDRDASLQQERDEAVREMERQIQRLHVENAAKIEQMQDVIRAQDSAIQELKTDFEEQIRMQREHSEHQMEEYKRTERNVVELRETLRNEKEAAARVETLRNQKAVETHDQAHMQELTSQELRRLMEAMALERERDVRLEQERDDSMRKMEQQIQQLHEENAVNVEQVQEVISVLESAIEELQKKIEEQTHSQKAHAERQQAENQRAGREIVELRGDLDSERDARAQYEKLHDEKEEETRDQVLMQEVECQELRRLIEGMVCEQRESNARVQQEHNDATREMERRLREVQVEIADNAAMIQELASKLQEDTRTQADHLRMGRERTEDEMVELRKILHDEVSARMQEVVRAQELATKEWNRREDEVALAQSEREERLEEEYIKVTEEIEERLRRAQADILGKGAQAQEALRLQALAVDGLKSQMVSVVEDIRLGDRPLRKALQSISSTYGVSAVPGYQVSSAIINIEY